jgi:DegV family protein with EDD domain
MSKICIVTDSAISMGPEEAKEFGVVVAPLSVMVDGREYKDYVELSIPKLYQFLREKADIKTSQPNLGLLHDLMSELKAADYDDIIIFPLSRHLSGTYQAFVLSALQNEMTNVTIVDTGTLVGPQRYVSLKAAEMARMGKSKQEILTFAEKIFNDTVSFVIPETLDQLKRSGRISSAAATLSALLKLKVSLILENRGTSIGKFETARTDGKLYLAITDKMSQLGFNAKSYKVFVPHADGLAQAEKFVEHMAKVFPGVEYEYIELPSAVAAHAGLKTYAVQLVLKN